MKSILLTLFSLSTFAACCQLAGRPDSAYRMLWSSSGPDTAAHMTSVYAHFPQGADSMRQFIKYHLIYPEPAWQHNIQGQVICQFMVDPDGHLSDINIIKSLSPEADSEALRIIRSLPDFVPTTYNNVPQRTTFTLHIPFSKPTVCPDPDRGPEFPCGDSALLSFVMSHMPYPHITDEIIGKLIFTIVADADGSVVYASTSKGFGPQYQQDVKAFFRSAPKFKPAMKNGRPVCAEMRVPVEILLRER